jgi:hypothetical protein
MSRSKCVRLLLAAAVLCPVLNVSVRADDPPAQEGGDAAKPKLQPVDFRKLKELMPAEVSGLKRTKHEGQKLKIGDFTLSSAEARYEKARPEGQESNDDENAPTVEVSITDYANAEAVAAISAAWTQADIDREGDDGYEKTVKVSGQPAMEKYEKEGKAGDLEVYAGGRFLVSIKTRNLPPEKMQEVAKAIQLDKLAAMK